MVSSSSKGIPAAHDAGVSDVIRVVVRDRLVLDACPKELRRQLIKDFTHVNPEVAEAKRGNRSTWGIPSTIQTWREDVGADGVSYLSLPRGGTGRLRTACKQHGYRIEWQDRRVQLEPVQFPPFRLTLRDYQEGAVAACLRYEQGLIKASTGSGKTCSVLAFISAAKQPAIVVMKDSNLLKQWAERVVSQMGIPKRQIGMLVGGKRKVGSRITLALQQTLNAPSFPLDDILEMFGCIVIDECVARGDVLMADGTLLPIQQVRVGDEVAVGGRVLGTMRRTYDGDVFYMGDALVTESHPIATSDGWVAASYICRDDLLWYDPLHDSRVHPLRKEAALEQPLRMVQATWSGPVRPCNREMQGMWDGGRVSSCQGFSHVDVFGQSRLEQGTYDRDGRACEGVRAGSTREARSPSCEGSTGRRSGRAEVEGGTCGRSEAALFGPGPKGTESGTDIQVDRRGQDHSLRRPRAWERWSADQIRAGYFQTTSSLWLPTRSGDQYEGRVEREVVPPGLGTPRGQGGGRDRWDESFEEGTTRVGLQEGLLPDVVGLDRVAIPGLGKDPARLERGRSSVRASGLQYVGTVYNLETEGGVYVVGGVLVHNCQTIASKTMQRVVDRFPARYRIGVSADHTRRDGMEFITHDVMGAVIHESARADLESSGAVVPVQVHAISTDFMDAAWMSGDREMTRIQSLIAEDDARNALVLATVRRLLDIGQAPLLVFVHRREHAKWLADTALYGAGIPCGLLLGGVGDATRFAEDRERLETGQLSVAVGTYNAIGQGIDIPSVRSAVVATPIGNNRQFFGQVRGRVCRPASGKQVGHLVYLWDHHLFGAQLGRVTEWSDGRCRQTTVERLLAP